MTTKADFTDEEWARLERAPIVAGMAISLADPGGPIEAVKESVAAIRTVTEAAQSGGGGKLVDSVAASDGPRRRQTHPRGVQAGGPRSGREGHAPGRRLVCERPRPKDGRRHGGVHPGAVALPRSAARREAQTGLSVCVRRGLSGDWRWTLVRQTGANARTAAWLTSRRRRGMRVSVTSSTEQRRRVPASPAQGACASSSGNRSWRTVCWRGQRPTRGSVRLRGSSMSAPQRVPATDDQTQSAPK
jgi:hypothetical protein